MSNASSTAQKVRFGVVGVGNMGGHHVNYINTLDHANLTAVTDINPQKVQRFKDRDDVRKFERYTEMLDSGIVDAVLIATPHYYHTEIARAAFERGLHVLCEKPLSVTIGDAKRLVADHEAKYSHLKFALMFQTRTVSIYNKIRDLIQSGELGEISRISWIVTDWFRTWTYYASGGWRATWAGEGGGVLLNQCPHNLDLMWWLTGMMPNRVTAVASIGKTHPIEVEDEVSAILQYPNGATGHFITSTGEAPGANRLEICGDRGKIVSEKGTLTFHRTRHSVREVLQKSPESFPTVETWESEIPYKKTPEGHKVVTENFVKAIVRDEPLIAPGREGVYGLELGNAMIYSGLTGRSVDLPLDESAYEQFIKDNIAKYGGKKAPAARSEAVDDVATSFRM